MPFDAIVHAPVLREGARLNIAETDQVEGVRPARLGIGAEVRLRFGVCCPDLSRGRIVAFSRQPSVAVLAIDAQTWTLQRGDDGGVATPGLVSESWFVTDGSRLRASPTEHSPVHSMEPAVAEG